MATIQYRVQYTGALSRWRGQGPWLSGGEVTHSIITVEAQNINAGYAKALKKAREPLGNGRIREIGAIEFWQKS
jgi:hypothetical protein